MTTVEDFTRQPYDFVICGGGTAGLVLAARLSENPDVTVAVIEAGGNQLNNMLVDTPSMFFQMFHDEKYDWTYKTVPQENNLGRRHHIVRGKMLGGSSGVNYMMYARGQKQEYDDWAELVGDDSWSYDGMAPYFRKSETFEPIAESITERLNYPSTPDAHGLQGPIHTSWNTTPSLPLEDAIIEVADKLVGYEKKPQDPWSGDHLGFYHTLGTIYRSGPNRGKRSYSARAYYEPVKDRKNLSVICEALVTRVILNGDVATGVEFTHRGESHKVTATREVIVCGGTIGSPQLLELSGIGDPETLKAAGVDCNVENAGVGNNYQDHYMCCVGAELVPGQISADIMADPDFAAEAMKALQENGDGPFTSIGTVQGYYPYSRIASEDELAETVQQVKDTPYTTEFQSRQLQKVIETLQSTTTAGVAMQINALRAEPSEIGIFDQRKVLDRPAGRPHGFLITGYVNHPASRGFSHITTSDPTAHPTIDPRYLSHPADLSVLAASTMFMDNMLKTEPLKSMVSQRYWPSPEVDLQDRKQAESTVKNWIMSVYHPVGTCAMGSVVDSHLRVNGVKGLRVCDASIFPNHVSGNTAGTVYAVAEKAADIIKADHGFEV